MSCRTLHRSCRVFEQGHGLCQELNAEKLLNKEHCLNVLTASELGIEESGFQRVDMGVCELPRLEFALCLKSRGTAKRAAPRPRTGHADGLRKGRWAKVGVI
eukprot:6204672-Pleurochrysis_carterae.AAC.3